MNPAAAVCAAVPCPGLLSSAAAGSPAGDWCSGAPQRKIGSCLRVVMAAGGRVSPLANQRSYSRDMTCSDATSHVCLNSWISCLLTDPHATKDSLDLASHLITRTCRRNSLSWLRSAASSPAAAKKSAAVCISTAWPPSLDARAALWLPATAATAAPLIAASKPAPLAG